MSEQRKVLEATLAAMQRGESAALALVVATEGSTYVRAGAMALFGAGDTQVGWLSGGCLEPEIAANARAAAQAGQLAWLDVDTRDDEVLFSGSAAGCRGRLHLALLPLHVLEGWSDLVRDWLGGDALELSFAADGGIEGGTGARRLHWRPPLASSPVAAPAPCRLRIAAPGRVLVFGAGPESETLLPLLQRLGWRATAVERRERWRRHAAFADDVVDAAPDGVFGRLQASAFAAALVMHHNFELDREALVALAPTAIPFVGLLGPARRREDLFQVVPAAARDALRPRLRSPIGLKLGGQGPEAIALSIAAQLQAWRSGEAT